MARRLRLLTILVALSAVPSCLADSAGASPKDKMIGASTPAAQVTRVSATVSPAGVSSDLTASGGGVYSGSLTVPAGGQTVRADAWAGPAQVGTGSRAVTVVSGQHVQASIVVLDSGGPNPVPDHSPVVTSLSVPATSASLGDHLAASATGMDADGDPIAYAWTAAPSGCGSFSPANAASTTWTAATLGTCTITATATANGKSDSRSASIAVGPARTFLPLAVSSNGRYLQRQDGTPFPLLGDAGWTAASSLTAAQQDLYIADRAAKGFSLTELMVISHKRGPALPGPPRNQSGDLPFTTRLDGQPWSGALTYANVNAEAPDFTTPNEAYWSAVDRYLTALAGNGLAVAMFPAYAGFQGGAEGWMAEVNANGATRMQTYGAWIATRYKAYPNIIWMLGGDYGAGPVPFTTSQRLAEEGMLAGLQSVAGQLSTQFAAEWSAPSINTDAYAVSTALGNAITLNGAYDWQDPVSVARNAYAYAVNPPVPRPAFLQEEPYDEEGPDGTGVDPYSTQPTRRYEWWGFLSTCGGFIYGNGYVWPFEGQSVWQPHLGSTGAQDMARLNAFVRSIQWWKLVPSGLAGMKNLITAGGSTAGSSSYVSAAADPAGALLVAYVPPAHAGQITVDMTAMSGPTRARWFNPATAAYTDIGAGLANTGTRAFTPPGDNSSGFTDWVLVLDLG